MLSEDALAALRAAGRRDEVDGLLAARRAGSTPLRSVRVPDEVWQAAKARAEAEGTTVSAVIVAAVRKYARGWKP